MSILPKLGERDKAVLNSIFNPQLPLGESSYDIFTDDKDEASEVTEDAELLHLEMLAIKYAEEQRYDDSLKSFDELVTKAPERATTFNNRAQVFRLIGDDTAAFNDLTKAIELGKERGKTCRQAYCQRGVLNRKAGNDEEARSDFQQAAKLGSSFAKQQLVEMNPYAALCNQMLSRAMKELN